jgi:hypothetical protein
MVHNNHVNQTLGTSPNQILLGYNVALTPLENATSNNQSANDRIKNMMEKHTIAIDAINRMARASEVIPSQYKEGTQVWLKVVNLKIKHQKTKLAPNGMDHLPWKKRSHQWCTNSVYRPPGASTTCSMLLYYPRTMKLMPTAPTSHACHQI